MSSPKVFVNVQAKKFGVLNVNGIQCSVDYYKRKGAEGTVVLSLDGCEQKTGEGFGGGTAVIIAPFSGPSAEQVIEDGLKRANAKKEEAHRVKSFSEIKERKGWAWLAVLAFAEKNGITIVPTPLEGLAAQVQKLLPG